MLDERSKRKGTSMTILLAQPLFADADGFGHMDGFGWSMMTMGWLFMVAVVGLIVWAVIRATSTPARMVDDPTISARRILADRFARGEIDDDEYRRRSDELGR
jgi:putative membrane protein